MNPSSYSTGEYRIWQITLNCPSVWFIKCWRRTRGGSCRSFSHQECCPVHPHTVGTAKYCIQWNSDDFSSLIRTDFADILIFTMLEQACSSITHRPSQQSAAQSSLVHALDTFLGVNHHDTPNSAPHPPLHPTSKGHHLPHPPIRRYLPLPPPPLPTPMSRRPRPRPAAQSPLLNPHARLNAPPPPQLLPPHRRSPAPLTRSSRADGRLGAHGSI
jgi:hypothetical protein